MRKTKTNLPFISISLNLFYLPNTKKSKTSNTHQEIELSAFAFKEFSAVARRFSTCLTLYLLIPQQNFTRHLPISSSTLEISLTSTLWPLVPCSPLIIQGWAGNGAICGSQVHPVCILLWVTDMSALRGMKLASHFGIFFSPLWLDNTGSFPKESWEREDIAASRKKARCVWTVTLASCIHLFSPSWFG